MKNKLIILGCGSSIGVPRMDGFWGKCNKNNKKNVRTRCSAIIINGSNSILIDTSPDIRMQLLTNKIKDISSVIFTHEHADQTNGLFELRAFYIKYQKKINIFSSSRTLNFLKKRQDYLFKKVTAYPPIVKPHIVKNNFSLGRDSEKIYFKSFTLNHGKTKVVVYVFKKTAYIPDCNDLSIINYKELKNLNYLIIDCLKFEKHPSHFNFDDVLFIREHLKPKKTILTNLYHDIDYDFLLRKLPKDVLPAYDGLILNL